MHHRSPATTSEQLFKQALDDAGRASFDGMVVIAEGADDSAADQLCRTMILDDESVMGGRPQLEVHADEVTATHGASIAQPQTEELLYLRSRGLDTVTARNLLIEGFLDEIAHGFSSEAAQALAHQQLALTLAEEP
jgi:Fe-S cluster assembly protein SufD